jgi:imidazolonepropionase-like amidohydrolase
MLGATMFRNNKLPCYLATLFILLALNIAIRPCFAQVVETTPPAEFDVVIIGGWLFQTDNAEFTPNKGIGIRDGRIVSLDALPPNPPAKQTIQLDDSRYILPGLVDCHAHYNVRLIRRRREEFNVTPVVYLANGVTTTFSCGEFDPEAMLALRKQIESGEQIGPRLINSGPYFGRARPGWRGEKLESEIREEVDFWAKQRVGGFKAKQIGPNELRVLIDQAHKHKLTVTGHLDSGFRNSVNPRDAIEMGIDRVEHFLGGDAMPGDKPAYDSLGHITAEMPEYKKIVQLFVDRGVWFDATITAYGYLGKPGEGYDHWNDERKYFTPYVQDLVKNREPAKPNRQFEEIYHAKLKTIKAYFDAGGKISLGTDHVSDGNYLPGFGAHRELDAFVRGGIPAAEALRIGTINGARALNIDADHGSIEVGKVADVFIIRGNPIENIRNTRNVEQVIRAGKIYDAAKLLSSVAGQLGPNSVDESGEW